MICGGANVQNSETPFPILTRIAFIEEYFHDNNLIVESLDDFPDDNLWMQELNEILMNYIEESDEVSIYAGDTEHDSAIQAIQTYSDILEIKNFEIHEFNRENLSFEFE